jgi:hypothetical protein
MGKGGGDDFFAGQTGDMQAELQGQGAVGAQPDMRNAQTDRQFRFKPADEVAVVGQMPGGEDVFEVFFIHGKIRNNSLRDRHGTVIKVWSGLTHAFIHSRVRPPVSADPADRQPGAAQTNRLRFPKKAESEQNDKTTLSLAKSAL